MYNNVQYTTTYILYILLLYILHNVCCLLLFIKLRIISYSSKVGKNRMK